LPEDNSLSKYREKPELFTTRWRYPSRLGNSSKIHPTDMQLYDVELQGEIAWMNLMYPSQSERTFDGQDLIMRCRKFWWLSYALGTMYIMGVWLVPRHMKDKDAYDLHRLLVIWNFVLAVFSFIGMVRTVPQLLMMMRTYGFEYTICRAARVSYGGGSSGFWTMLFIFSKYFELIDTLFLVLRKRKVGFLHWFHHFSVLVYCWHSWMWEMPTGFYFVTMNYTVHAVMYFYYFLAAVLQRPLSWGIYVTILQISQMFGGIVVNIAHLLVFLRNDVPNCDGHLPNVVAALVMYASYLYLFMEFLCKRYCKKHTKNGKSMDAKKLL